LSDGHAEQCCLQDDNCDEGPERKFLSGKSVTLISFVIKKYSRSLYTSCQMTGSSYLDPVHRG
jgi:hypothetical protein